MLFRLCDTLAVDHPQLATCRFTPHDFRRLFATDLVNHGLPTHIGAALRHYQTHLANRRAARPAAEYRPVIDTEWGEFEAHFDKRKVELGQCGRPYATQCEHEHACIRCPMLRIDPKMLDRLDEIDGDLLARRAHAETEGWLGEIEGIDLTLTFLSGKRDEASRLNRITPINLGMPALTGARESRSRPRQARCAFCGRSSSRRTIAKRVGCAKTGKNLAAGTAGSMADRAVMGYSSHLHPHREEASPRLDACSRDE